MDTQSDIKVNHLNIVYYDGSCPMCTMIANKIDSSSQSKEFFLRDITRDALPADFTKKEVEREMHVVGQDGRIYKNAEAILKILEAYPSWNFFVWIGRLRGIKHVLPIGYNLVAKNRHFLFGPASRVYWIKIIVSIGFIAGILLSPKLWLSSRFYPLTPVWNLTLHNAYHLDLVILLSVLCLLIGIILVSRPRRLIIALVAVITVLVLLDQSRLHPWVYQYVFMLTALGLFSWSFNDIKGIQATLNVCRFIIAAIYFWSGFQKLNLGFIGTVFPWVVDPIVQLSPEFMQLPLYSLGVFVPFIEMAIGIGLLTRKFRNIAIAFAFIMCVFLLWTLGPYGHNWNNVVWPWNIMMVLLTTILFAKTRNVTFKNIALSERQLFHKIVLVLFGILPLLYFFNIWDSYPSWSLYSGTTNDAEIYVSNRIKNELPDYLQQFVQFDSYGRNMLSISKWSVAELNVPPYPETRIFKNIARAICGFTDRPDEVVLIMKGRSTWFYSEGLQNYNCTELN